MGTDGNLKVEKEADRLLELGQDSDGITVIRNERRGDHGDGTGSQGAEAEEGHLKVNKHTK